MNLLKFCSARDGIKNTFDHLLRPTFHSLLFEWPDETVYSLDSDADWESLLPKGTGFTHAIDQQREDKIIFSVAMYHQLHCLGMLRRAHAYFRQGGLASEFIGETHVSHCFTYLRQSSLCAADMTLESASYELDSSGNWTLGVDGMGIKHKCRNPDLLRRYLEMNYEVYSKTKQSDSRRYGGRDHVTRKDYI